MAYSGLKNGNLVSATVPMGSTASSLPPGGVTCGIEAINQTIEGLIMQVVRLDEKTACVRFPEQTGIGNDKMPEPGPILSPVGHALRDAAERIESLTARLRYLTESFDL